MLSKDCKLTVRRPRAPAIGNRDLSIVNRDLLATALFAEPSPAVIKGVLHALGKIPSPAVRLPLLPATEESVRAALGLLYRAADDAGRGGETMGS